MPDIGECTVRLVRLARTLAAADTFGERVESWAADGKEWWAKREDVSAAESLQNGLKQSGLVTRFTVNGRLLPASLADVDKVQDKATGETFLILGVRLLRFETLVDCEAE